MDRTERCFKLSTTILFSSSMYYINGRKLLRAIVAGHILNFLLNGHLWGLMKKFDVIHTSSEEFDAWFNTLEDLGTRWDSIASVVVFGSMSRDELNSTSDLDVRVVRYPGAWNGLQASLLICYCRFRALVEIFPIDIYLRDNTGSFEHLRDDEEPVVLVDKENIIE